MSAKIEDMSEEEFYNQLADKLVSDDDLREMIKSEVVEKIQSEATASKSYGERLAMTGSNNPKDYPVGDDQLEAQADRADPEAIPEMLGLNGRDRDEDLDDYSTGEL